jgi:nucleotide-binding universal stress UspA family protein
MKILCATDFTPRARAAAKVGIELVRRTGGSVELVHVVQEPNADLQALMFVGGAVGEEIRESLKVKLAAESQEIASGGEIAVTHHLGEGDPVLTPTTVRKTGSARQSGLASRVLCGRSFLPRVRDWESPPMSP